MSHSTSRDDQPAAESKLGQMLALVHRVLPRLNEPARAADVQDALRQAAALLETARAAHAHALMPAGAGHVAPGVAPEIAAAIAAAVSVVLDRPHRSVLMQHAPPPIVPHFNVWALEGRTQIFQSHKVR